MEQILSWIEINPNKNATVKPISVQLSSDTNDATDIPVVGPGGVGVVPLDPPGPVSLYLWNTNPEYRAGNFLNRKTILRSFLVLLNERFDKELKGRHWSKNLVLTQLQEQESAAVSPPQKTFELNKALTHILGFQYVEVDEIHKKMYVYPEDLRSWSHMNPVYLASYGCRSIYTQNCLEDARTFFKTWFYKLESSGYTYTWPKADGTVKDLKEKLATFNLNKVDDKIKKDELCAQVGKMESIIHINSEFS